MGILCEYVHDLEFLHDGKTREIGEGDAWLIAISQAKLIRLLKSFQGNSFHGQQSKLPSFEDAAAEPSCFRKRTAGEQTCDRLIEHIVGRHPKAAAFRVPLAQSSYFIVSRLGGILQSQPTPGVRPVSTILSNERGNLFPP